jgi:hypothetical protein
VDAIKEHLTCGLCNGPFAQSLVLTCSHLFCGDCLLKRLSEAGIGNTKQSCPTCNMDLRAVPVRCLAMDKVAAAIVPSLPQDQQQAYSKRCRDGQTAADQINKMLWWLTPGNTLGPGGPLGAGGPSTPTAALHSAAAAAGMLGAGAFGGMSMGMSTNPSVLGGLGDPKASSGLPAPFGALGAAAAAAAAAHQPFGPAGLSPYGGLGAGLPPHLAGAGNPVLQMAMAAHMAQAQEAVRKLQLNAPAAAAAAAAAAANMHGPAFMPEVGSLQHALLGQERAAAAAAAMGGSLGAAGQPRGYTADQQLQLSNLMASMCQV